MTTAENLARLFPLHYQRIVELVHEQGLEDGLDGPSLGRRDLATMFVWDHTEEGHNYWRALAR